MSRADARHRRGPGVTLTLREMAERPQVGDAIHVAVLCGRPHLIDLMFDRVRRFRFGNGRERLEVEVLLASETKPRWVPCDSIARIPLVDGDPS